MEINSTISNRIKRRLEVKAPKDMGNWRSGDPVDILFGVSKCKFLTPYPKKIKKELEIFVPGYRFSPKYKRKQWDGKKKFITDHHYFMTGLLPVVYAMLKTGKSIVNFYDFRGDENLKKRKVILRNPPKKVRIQVPEECKQYFSPTFLRWYIYDFDLLSGVSEENSSVEIPIKMLKSLKLNSENTVSTTLFFAINGLSDE